MKATSSVGCGSISARGSRTKSIAAEIPRLELGYVGLAPSENMCRGRPPAAPATSLPLALSTCCFRQYWLGSECQKTADRCSGLRHGRLVEGGRTDCRDMARTRDGAREARWSRFDFSAAGMMGSWRTKAAGRAPGRKPAEKAVSGLALKALSISACHEEHSGKSGLVD